MAARKNWEASTKKKAEAKRKKFQEEFRRWFLQWQINTGAEVSWQHRTMEDLGKLLGVPGATVRMWYNGLRAPDGESVDKLAALVGPAVYGWLDQPMPDSRLTAIIAAWPKVPEKTRDKLLALVQSVTS